MRLRLKRTMSSAMTILAVFTLAGCGTDESKPDNEQVEGVVTLDGKPVPGAVVTFVPVDDKQGVSATGTTDDEGRYTLTTIERGVRGGSGAVAGEYYVGVVKDKPLPEDPDTDEPGYGEDEGTGREEDEPEITHIVPAKYNRPQDSGIKVTVEKGKNEIPIKLTPGG